MYNRCNIDFVNKFMTVNVYFRLGGTVNDIQMRFKAASPDGLLFWVGHDQPMLPAGDYLALGFRDGALQFRYNLGSGEAVISYNDTKLYDGRWHVIRAQRRVSVFLFPRMGFGDILFISCLCVCLSLDDYVICIVFS